jgi:hypothetical protein
VKEKTKMNKHSSHRFLTISLIIAASAISALAWNPPVAPQGGGMPPSVIMGGHTALPHVGGDSNPGDVHLMDVTGGATIEIMPLYMVSQNSPSSGAALALALHDAIAGTLPGTTNGDLIAPTNYLVRRFKMDWPEVAYSAVPEWNGSFNSFPSGFDGQIGPEAIGLVVATANSGQDVLSLDQVVVKTASNDGNHLGSTNTFAGFDYSTLAVGVKADGSWITTGPTDQKAAKVLVFVIPPRFNSGGTASGMGNVRDWVMNAWTPGVPDSFVLSFMAQIVGNDSTQTVTTLGTAGVTPSRPMISITADHKIIVQGDPGTHYAVELSYGLDHPVWHLLGSVPVGTPFGVALGGPGGIIRARAQ